ncbi:MAG: hypothetical protein KO206_05830, partial [Methanomicrobiaceae archaeon]|nr:hypothetical protein [Methanomicrobiaceae archaeon]
CPVVADYPGTVDRRDNPNGGGGGGDPLPESRLPPMKRRWEAVHVSATKAGQPGENRIRGACL